jgi:hypothetical protein
MSALPPKADIAGRDKDVRFVPKADIMRCSNRLRSIEADTAESSPAIPAG